MHALAAWSGGYNTKLQGGPIEYLFNFILFIYDFLYIGYVEILGNTWCNWRNKIR
jgi:hypothetical protein